MNSALAVSGWSAVSAVGVGATEFSEGIRSGRSGLRNPRSDSTLPDGPAGAVPGFDVREALGRKNTRAMDRLTGLAVLTVATFLDGERELGQELDGDNTGLVLGTAAGSLQSMMDFITDSFTQDKPYLVDPARFPNMVMNRAAGQSAIWHGLRGPNATIASGQAAGLSALHYAARLHRGGHTRNVLCGAVEELTPQRVWLEGIRAEDGEDTPLGEGCAVFRLESPEHAAEAARPVLAHLAATSFRVHASTAEIPKVLADCASSALRTAEASADDVWAVAADLTDQQDVGLRGVVGEGPRRLGLTATLGDTGAASGALQVAAVLCHAAEDRTSRGRLALIASVDRDGLVGVAALRFPRGS